MREIKFRGINNDGNWCFGDLIQSNNDHNVWIHAPKINHTYKVDPATVGQYTGLLDSNGQEIYEGDIVKATLKEPSFVKRFRLQNELVGEMFFDNAWWMKERETVNLIPPWRLRYYDLTVIGNVHDNHDLLEVAHD